MSKKEKHPSKPNPTAKNAGSISVSKSDLFEKLNAWFELNDKKIFYSLLFLSTLFSFIMFDAKVSDGGDDSSYIERAWSLLNEGKFPYFQGPGYPIIWFKCDSTQNVFGGMPFWFCMVYL